ncbi:MAG: diguanylate cyclase, partial [Armatimonadetes bacterium]|nr:diguanylate cyclase [Armatimonadota bacterium]
MRFVSQCLPLGVKVFLVCVISAILVSSMGSAVLYRGASHSLRQQLREYLMATAATAALQVDPRLHALVKTEADRHSSAYYIIQRKLRAMRRANPEVHNVYTMRKTASKNTWQFIVDVDGGPDTPVGCKYDVSELPEMQKAFDGPSADKEPARDKWGTWLSGYAPIRDAGGRAALRTFALAFLLAVVVSLLVTRVLLNRVHVFSRAAERVRAGDLEFQLESSGSPEVRRFTDAFNSMIGGLKLSRERLMEEATRDALTGLYNHVYFQDVLASEIKSAGTHNQSLCLMIFDIDHFKGLNDAFGYSVGARVIRQIGDLLRQSIREGDILARYGGDEFAMILPDTDIETGRSLAEKLRRSIETQRFRIALMDEVLPGGSVPDDREVTGITVTAGLVNYPDNQRSRDGLVMAAEIAVSRAKHKSRNSVCVYDVMAGHDDDELDLKELYQV